MKEALKAWRRISTDEIGLHVSSPELRRQVATTESLLLSRSQALRLIHDISELLAESPEPETVSMPIAVDPSAEVQGKSDYAREEDSNS